MFELWMLWFLPLAIVVAGFMFGIAAYVAGYEIVQDYDEVDVDD